MRYVKTIGGRVEFLVEFEVKVPDGTPNAEVVEREKAEASAAARLAEEGHLIRLWRMADGNEGSSAVGLYRASTEAELHELLRPLPLTEWMRVTVTRLDPHPNDPVSAQRSSDSRASAPNGKDSAMGNHLPDPQLTLVYRLTATLGEPLDLGASARGRRRIVPQTGGTFTGPKVSGKLLPGASADWQLVLPDGTSLADLRYTLQTEEGDLLYVRSRGTRYGPAEVLARLGRGEDVDASEYTFRTLTEIETTAPELDWLNKGVLISVGGRQPAGVIYETYLVG
jgi:muconolactone delta-isomerase